MLSESVRNLVKATVPVLKESGVALTSHFYARMFKYNPELKQIFNQGHQQGGHQQTALAMAVLAYAENIDDPSVLAPVVHLIANKHVSLGIRAEHYPIVGHHLLESIKEVLGDAATDELISAWAEAYGQLADIFIDAERKLYAEATQAKGGWSGWRSFRVKSKHVESEEITSFYLHPLDGGETPHFKAGQYISVRVYAPTFGLMQPRQYSLSDAPNGEYFRISVKREQAQEAKPAGAVSNRLHHDIHVNDIIDVAPPMGDFYLHTERQSPAVLISGGVGLTPMIAMLNQLNQSQDVREVRFVHGCRHGNVHAMKAHVQATTQEHSNVKSFVFYENPNAHDVQGKDYDYAGRIDLQLIKDQILLADADYYLCGPIEFMRAQKQSLLDLGVSPDHIFAEVFGTGGFLL
ncbi:MAG: NO-inducible flavohemoprotein [Candidatus Saccharibacteria bacterium]|nr:NO-inducible flavohemoprotein [Moraxellaceae bacterium]